MEGILIDYHQMFIVIAIAVFLLTVLLIFGGDQTKEKAIGAMILIGFNNNLCWINVLGFLAINVYGFDASGTLVNNPIADMYFGWALFFGLGLVNIGLMFYLPKLFVQTGSKEFEKEPQPAFKGSPPQHRIRP